MSVIKRDLTVVMPALNEEQNILPAVKATLKAFKDLNINGEITVVNDGSTDKTEELISGMMQEESRIRMIKHTAPEGIGASFWDGVKEACGDAVVLIPGDNEVDSEEALRYFPLMQHVDIIIPFVYNRNVRSRFRNYLSCIFIFIINVTFRVNLNYTNGTVIYRKSVLSKLSHYSNGFFFQAESLIKLIKQGYLFAEVPYYLQRRKYGASTAVNYPSFYSVVKGYFNLIKAIYLSADYANDKSKLNEESISSKRYKAYEDKR